jgi:hypothetical protein
MQQSRVVEQFLLSVLSSLVAVGIVLIAERQRRPALRFEIEPVPPIRADGAKFLRVRIRNHGLPRFLRAVNERQPALMTRVWVTLYHLDDEPVFARGRRMRGRWSDTPDPFRVTPVSPTMVTPADGLPQRRR